MSQANEDNGSKTPMWVVMVEGILEHRDDEYTSFHDLAWAVSDGIQDFEYAISECRHSVIARAFLMDQKSKAKRNPS